MYPVLLIYFKFRLRKTTQYIIHTLFTTLGVKFLLRKIFIHGWIVWSKRSRIYHFVFPGGGIILLARLLTLRLHVYSTVRTMGFLLDLQYAYYSVVSSTYLDQPIATDGVRTRRRNGFFVDTPQKNSRYGA